MSSTKARAGWARWTTALAIVGANLVSPSARADPAALRCSDAARTWCERCGAAAGFTLTPITCLDGRLVVEAASAGGSPLRVDVARGAGPGLLRAGGAAISPVGDFPDWSSEPTARHAALALVASCVERDPSVLEKGFEAAPPANPARPDSPPPSGGSSSGLALAAVAALAALGVAAVVVWRRRARAARLSSPNAAGGVSPSAVGRHLAFFAVCAVVEVWAQLAADPDFPIPDPFHPLMVGLLVVYGASLLVPWRQLRYVLVTLAFGVPALVLTMEAWLAFRDRSMASDRLLFSEDRLLRYNYRPGAVVRGPDASEPLTVTADGLLDVAHAVPKPEGVTRVVVLGDSVPNDVTVPFSQRFPKRLEAMLAESAQGGRRIEVINVSCEGYNTIQEVRLFEKVGLRYEPDVVVVAYVLNDPFLQNGAYRRFGNSFFAFRMATMASAVTSSCSLFAPLHEGYAFDLVVRSSLERLRLLAEQHHFRVLVAALPIVERFDDPVCLACYDKVVDVARAQGFEAARVVDAFRGEDYRAFLKPNNKRDVTHPNAAGHGKIARKLAELVTPMLSAAPGEH